MSDKKTIRSTFKHALIYSTSGILSKAIGFVMLPVYAHYLRGEGYGIIGMIDVVLSVLAMLIGFGVQSAMSRFYFERKDGTERQKLVSTAIILMFCLVVTICLPVLLFGEKIAWLAFGKKGLGFYITLAGITFIADMTSKCAESYIFIRQKSGLYTFLSLLRLGLALALNITLIVYLKMGVLGYLYSGLIVAVVFTVIQHCYALMNVGIHFVKEEARSILRFSLPLLPGYLAMFFRNNADRILLRTFLGLSMLGAYEMLFKFATLVGFLLVEPFNKIWNVKRFEIAEDKDGPRIMARVYTLHLSVMLFGGLILSVEIPVILKILTPEEFWLGGVVAGLAVLSRILMASYYHFFFGLLYSKKTQRVSVIHMVTAVVNVVLALALIKPFGVIGAVVVSCLSNLFQCAFAFCIARKEYKIPYEWGRVGTILFLSITLFLLVNWVGISGYPGFSSWITETLLRPLENMMRFMHLDSIRDGKILAYTLTNIPLLIEGAGKFLLCFTFLGVLILCGIIPSQPIVDLLKNRSLKPLFALGGIKRA